MCQAGAGIVADSIPFVVSVFRESLDTARIARHSGRTKNVSNHISYLMSGSLTITIRTGIIKDGKLYVQARAGIVADSVPQSEWIKARIKEAAPPGFRYLLLLSRKQRVAR